jgi:hypothetical protein
MRHRCRAVVGRTGTMLVPADQKCRKLATVRVTKARTNAAPTGRATAAGGAGSGARWSRRRPAAKKSTWMSGSGKTTPE